MNKVLKKAVIKDHNFGTSLYIINKGTIAPASDGKKNETVLKIATLRKFLAIRCSGKL